VARRLGVHRQSVNRWAKALKSGGRSGLRRAPRAGRPPKLNEAEMAQLEQCLKQGPRAIRIPERAVDAGAGRQADRAAAWRAVRFLAGVAHPAQA
jgi:transposase